MNEVVLTAAASLAWLVVMFGPLERAFPAREGQRFLRADFVTDLLFFFGQHLLFAATAVTIIGWATQPLDGFARIAEVRQGFSELGFWLQLIVVLALGDFVTYWGHRLQHALPLLWRFHAVHHTSTEVDWLAAHREHPLDGVYTQTLVNLPALVLGFNVSAVLGVVAFRSLWAIFIHSNVQFGMGPLKYLLGSPKLHRWHHAKDQHAGNYANLAPWLDVLFGTYRCPDGLPTELGVEDPYPRDYIGLLLAPFRRRASDGPRSSAEPAYDVVEGVAAIQQ